jgi:hypothetical protein
MWQEDRNNLGQLLRVQALNLSWVKRFTTIFFSGPVVATASD